MSLIKEFPDKGATVAWSTVASQRDLIALGTKDGGSAGFDDFGGELELHKIDFVDENSPTLLGSVKTNARFSKLAWSEMANRPEFTHGIIAGGMSDGSVNFWDPSKLVHSPSTSKISSEKHHSGPVNGLMFNPHRTSNHLLASGGADSSVYIMALDRPDQPDVFMPAPKSDQSKHTAGITSCAWNSKVSHILASASADGICVIWDLRQKKPWCELREVGRSMISDIAWNPDEGLTLVTALGDDNNPVIKLWDLRSSTTLPLATLQDHTQGILSIDWCPSDSSLLMSCAKDNRTLLWDLYNLKAVYELPSKASTGNEDNKGNIFGGLGNSSNRRYQVSWSPIVPSVIATCSFDRKVQVFSMMGAKNTAGRAPKSMLRKCGASFGFGGKMVCFGASPQGSSKMVTIHSVRENENLVKASRYFESAIANKDYRSFCEERALAAHNSNEKMIWQFMQVNFESNAREKLLQCLGFDAKVIAEELSKIGTSNSPGSSANAESVFASDTTVPALSLSMGSLSLEGNMTKDAEVRIKKALLVGNFKAAVRFCLETGNMADALLLASCGGAELWAETQAEYFCRASSRKPFLKIVKGIINSELNNFVEDSYLRDWRETLAVISTYSKAEEFPLLCEALALRLEDAGKEFTIPATLCYMCALDIVKTVEIWVNDLYTRNRNDAFELHNFVEKVSVLVNTRPGTALEPEVTALFAKYAGNLASEGEIEAASAYISGEDLESMKLKDRLYHGSANQGQSAPPFPFEKRNVMAQIVQPTQPRKEEVVQRQNTAQNVPTNSYVSSSKATGSELPQNWSQMIDPRSGMPYYCNKMTGETQWEKPAVVTPSPRHLTAAANSYQRQNPIQAHSQAQNQAKTLVQSQEQYQAVQGKVQLANHVQHQTQSQAKSTPHSQPSMSSSAHSYMPMHSHNQGMPLQANASVVNPQMSGPAQNNVNRPVPSQLNSMGQPSAPTVSTQPFGMVTRPGGVSRPSAPTTPTVGRSSHGPQSNSSSAGFKVTTPGLSNSSKATSKPSPVPRGVAAQATPTDPIELAKQASVRGEKQSYIVSSLQQTLASLEVTQLNPAERKGLAEGTKAVLTLYSCLASGRVEDEVVGQLVEFCRMVQGGELMAANGVYKSLVGSVWNGHKDWLKGFKHIAMLSKKI
eukprot:CAMPEP_0171481444 /NCGR_PEP_ID=MMETSP0946-20130122/6749_1 /TAXON_ID=109269 /ORGANISM="Vaucheria litorea, Strain CCMP2940" /LENGTH=1148 /DNA_ID=CAMNT_0012013017 /DNA_START=6 /DNA_END=3452 /DNA_ORIENTATION=+